MKCQHCQNNFRYIQIPVENRIMEAGSTRFICPCERLWLKPRRKFALLTILGLFAIAIPIILSAFSRIFGFHFSDDMNWLFSGILLIGIIFTLIGTFTVELEVLGEVMETTETE